MRKIAILILTVVTFLAGQLTSCRRQFADDNRLPSRDVLIRLCWQTFDVALKEKSDFIQNSTLRTLGRIGNKAAVETIRSVDLGGKRSIVKSAVRTLAQIPDSASYLALAGYTRSPDFQVRELAVSGLTSMHALYDDSVTIRILLRTMGDLDSIPVDSMMYDSLEIAQEKIELQAKIAVALLKFNVGSVRRYVEKAHAHPQFQFRAAIVRMIGDVNPPQALSMLRNFENDPMDYVRAKVVEAMAKIGSQEAFARITSALNDNSESVQVAAASELMKIHEPLAVEKLLVLQVSLDDEIRSRAILALGDTKDPIRREVVARKLLPLLDDPVDLIRVATIGSIGKLGDTASIPMLEKKLEDDSEDVRELTVGVLARLGGRKMFDRLAGWLTDEKYAMREVAIAGLGSIEDADLQPRIIRLVYARMRNDDEMTVRVRAAFTLLDLLHEHKYTKPKTS